MKHFFKSTLRFIPIIFGVSGVILIFTGIGFGLTGRIGRAIEGAILFPLGLLIVGVAFAMKYWLLR